MSWRTAWRYGWISAIALIATALSGVILQSQYSLYLAYDPTAFVQQGWALIGAVAGLAALGAWFDRGQENAWARGARSLVLGLVFVGLFQVLRRALATSLALGFGLKLGLLALMLLLAALAAWKLRAEALWRLARAGCLMLAVTFALQPGAPGYVLSLLSPAPRAVPPETNRPPAQRVIVLVLDEWDLEISRQVGLFEQPPLAPMMGRSLFAEQVMPAGPDTLSAIPSMLLGRRYGPVVSGGPGYVQAANGDRFDGGTETLLSDLARQGRRSSVVGFFHDYCRLFSAVQRCVAEPVQLFPGWSAALARAVRSGNDIDSVFSDFMRQWRSSYERLHAASLDAVRHPDSELLWLHLNLPHPPMVEPEATVQRGLGADYRANLRQTARVIQEVQSAIQATGIPTTLLLTSDHWLREQELWAPIYERQLGPGQGQAGKSDDQHVPFIAWFSHGPAGSGVAHAAPFSTTILRTLVPALLDGTIDTPQALSDWLQRQPPGDLTRFHKTSDSAGVH